MCIRDSRKVHRAYWRTRDGNFSLHGLLGFDMYGKTAGIVGTGKIARELIRCLLYTSRTAGKPGVLI